jgi:hypothetical protein
MDGPPATRRDGWATRGVVGTHEYYNIGSLVKKLGKKLGFQI